MEVGEHIYCMQRYIKWSFSVHLSWWEASIFPVMKYETKEYEPTSLLFSLFLFSNIFHFPLPFCSAPRLPNNHNPLISFPPSLSSVQYFWTKGSKPRTKGMTRSWVLTIFSTQNLTSNYAWERIDSTDGISHSRLWYEQEFRVSEEKSL